MAGFIGLPPATVSFPPAFICKLGLTQFQVPGGKLARDFMLLGVRIGDFPDTEFGIGVL
jgi:hypothetical protein